MPLNVPASVSRAKPHFFAWHEFDKVLGKRERDADEKKQQPGINCMAATGRPYKKDPIRRQHPLTTCESSDSESQSSAAEEIKPKMKQNKRVKLSQVQESSLLPRTRGAPAASHLTPSRAHTSAPRSVVRRQSLPTVLAVDIDVTNMGTNSRQCTKIGSCERQETCKPAFPKVFRISCATESERKSRHHATFLYEDDPLLAHSTENLTSSHLSGQKPVYQLQDYVQQFQQSSFIIITNRKCNGRLGLSPDDGKRNESMLILDNSLRQAIQKVATCPTERMNESSELLEMPAPYQFLYLHREALQQYAQAEDASIRTAIEAVIRYIETSHEAEYAEAADLMSRGKITWHHVTKLFRPNQMIIVRPDWLDLNDSEQEIGVVKSWPQVHRDCATLEYWSWALSAWGCNRSPRHVRIDPPTEDDHDEPFDINKLKSHPVTFLSPERIEQIRDRGKRSWNLRRPSFVHYHNENHAQGNTYVKPGRYMIDNWMYENLHVQPPPPPEVWSKQTDPWRANFTIEQQPTEDEFLMMPHRAQGYDLLEKEWISLLVANTQEVLWNKQPFEDLVLHEDTKHLVKAMVTLRASTIKKKREKSQSRLADFDLIPGKGNGLIMLFHGSPGTGKTLTAESVAEIAEMPLYPITCGDIGTEPDKVEQYLRLVFMLGKRWNCVLLLDEADVFLEERTLTDLQRNSLVSVFLRMLEYYDGILILTSNRVGTFDEAFRSRIHIALHYEDLKPRSRKQIWNNFLARLEATDEGENVEEIKYRVDELAKHKLNGREIRNALSTARQLASHEGVKMTWRHLELAIKTVNDFGNYLRDVHGHSDREWVRETRTR